MQSDLSTTNQLLGVMAVVSILEAIVVVGIGVASWRMYRHVMELIRGLEQRHVVPLRARVDSILDDVKGVTGTVKDETHRVEHAIRKTMDRVDDTTDRVRATVRNHLVGVGRGIRVALQAMLHSRHQMPAGRAQARLPRWETRAQQAESD